MSDASIVGCTKEWTPKKNKAKQEERRNTAQHAPRIVLTNPPQALAISQAAQMS